SHPADLRDPVDLAGVSQDIAPGCRALRLCARRGHRARASLCSPQRARLRPAAYVVGALSEDRAADLLSAATARRRGYPLALTPGPGPALPPPLTTRRRPDPCRCALRSRGSRRRA